MSEGPRAYDVIVIGNGAAGDNIARTLARRGKRVAVVERGELGGECLNVGCVPSKALIHVARGARHQPLPWAEVVARVHAAQLLVRGPDPDGGFVEAGIDLFRGEASFSEATTVSVGGVILTAKDVVVATGTAPALPPVPGLAEARPQTNRTIFRLPEFPQRLGVLGGGAIGLELGQSFHRLGATVTILEAAPVIAATEDAEVSIELRRLLELEGLRVEAGVKIEHVARGAGGAVTVRTPGGVFEFDDLLVAAGRRPEVPDGLAGLGLSIDKRGYIAMSPCGKTNLDGVWAAGDVTGKFQLTHYAGYQAHHIARHLLTGECQPIPDAVVPWAVFTDPEVGHAGMTEEQARASGADVRMGKLDARDLDWFRTTGTTDGFAKVVVDGSSGRILGAHFLFERASAVVGEACLAIQHGLTARQVAETIHPYPTASEIFRWACARAV